MWYLSCIGVGAIAGMLYGYWCGSRSNKRHDDKEKK